jgi:DNA-binding CsgD family transcriptional regulator
MSSAKFQTKESPNSLFFSIPSDLFPLIFSFLSPKELCCLDSAILNHANRPIFLSALIQRFTKESIFVESSEDLMMPHACWYLYRRIPVTALDIHHVLCHDILSMNSNSLKEISLCKVILEDEDILALGQCLNLKKLGFFHCPCPDNLDIDLLLNTLTNLEDLELYEMPFSELTAEIISRNCRSLKSLYLSSLSYVEDDDLRLLVEGCPLLRSLTLYFLDISEESVQMLRNHRPRIPSIGIFGCEEVSFLSVGSLLNETTIPTIFDSDTDDELKISAIKNLCYSIRSFPDFERTDILAFLSRDSLLQRLIELFPLKKQFRLDLLILFRWVTKGKFYHLMVDSGIAPLLIQYFDSLNEMEMSQCLLLLHADTCTASFHRHFLTCGVLSIFRPNRIREPKVSG